MPKADIAKKRSERIAAKEKISNTLLIEFVYCIVASLYLMMHMWFWNRGQVSFVVEVLHVWTAPVCVALALFLAFLPKITKDKVKFGKVRPWVYFFSFLGIIYLIYYIHIKVLFLADISWLSFFKFGNERYGAMPWGFFWIWLSFVGFIVKCVVKLKNVSKK